MVLKWVKSKKEISKEQLEEAKMHGNVKIRKAHTAHAKAKALAESKNKYEE